MDGQLCQPLWRAIYDHSLAGFLMCAPEGVRSKVASDYYVLATPVMVLLDAKTKEIVSVPNTLNELLTAIQ